MAICIKGENISEERIINALKDRAKGISTYIELMKIIEKEKELPDEFKEEFKKFYGMKRCKFSDEFYDKYFEYLDKNRKMNNPNYKEIEFSEVIDDIWKTKTSKRVEASFSSKLLASINNEKPVWDSNVFSRLKMTRTASIKDKDKQIKKTISKYKDLENEINSEFFGTKKTNNGDKCIHIFDKFFNETFEEKTDLKYITPMKKIDLILWSLGKKEKKNN